ncbi:MAG: hypothetical protein ACREA2_03000 [Blastocatellia bacterium]
MRRSETSLTAFAQSPPESASQKSYAQARQILGAGIKAVGGLEALQAANDITREMTGARSDQGQGLRPVPATQSGKPPVTNPYTKATSVRDLRGQRVMEYRETSQVGGTPFKYRRILGGNSTFFVNYTVGVIYQNTPPNIVLFWANA